MLCRALKVSKITIREAMKLLVNDGKVVRIPGKGTFVSKPKLEQKLNKFFGFSKWALQNGLNPASRLRKVETLESNSHIAKHLGITAGDPVTGIERLRLGNDKPLMFEEIWISGSLCPSLHLKDIANIPLNEIITNDYEIQLLRGVMVQSGKVADARSPPPDPTNTWPRRRTWRRSGSCGRSPGARAHHARRSSRTDHRRPAGRCGAPSRGMQEGCQPTG